MCRRVVLVGEDVSEERIAYIFKVKTTIVLFLVHRFFHPDEGGARFLRNLGSYKSHTA
jgi:hypothetical protein